MPEFCDALTFRLVHLGILDKQIMMVKFDFDYFVRLILANEYFVCEDANIAIENQLV